MNHTAGIDKMDLDIGRTGCFFQIKGGRRETRQRIERPALQQFSQGTLQGHFKTGVSAKAGKATLVFGMKQGHVHHRILAAQ